MQRPRYFSLSDASPVSSEWTTVSVWSASSALGGLSHLGLVRRSATTGALVAGGTTLELQRGAHKFRALWTPFRHDWLKIETTLTAWMNAALDEARL